MVADVTYRVGIGDGMQRLGFQPREPHIACDGCGQVYPIGRNGRCPPQWFFDSKAPPKWKKLPDGRELCPRCKEEKPTEPKP